MRTRRLLGSGGYNAALMAELVGPADSVTTLDTDPVVTDRATRFLAQTEYDHVQMITADAEHLPAGTVPDGGFDAILVTVDTWDLPWIDALAEGGRLVAPLRLHGYHWAIGFTESDGALHSDDPLIVCGFVAMQGDGAWNPNRRTVAGTGVHLSWEDGTPLPVDQLAPALVREPTVAHTHVTVGGQEPFDALALYLAGALPGFCRMPVRGPEPAARALARRRDRPRYLPRAAGHRASLRRRRGKRPVRVRGPRLRSPRPPGREGDGRTGPALAAQLPRRPLPAHHHPPLVRYGIGFDADHAEAFGTVQHRQPVLDPAADGCGV
ncbi:methyltransferase domain-containing protein, partial [Streptomyces sp. NPDC003016]